MKAPKLHLNLLRPEEVASSSPVRMRVMMPLLSLLLCVACVVWWGILFMQGLLQATPVKREIELSSIAER